MYSTFKTATLSCLGLCAIAAASISPAAADMLPYPNPGTENPTTYTFTAASKGVIRAYVYAQSTSDFTDTLGLLVNNVDTGQTGPSNKDAAGTYVDLGFAQQGALLTFILNVAGIGNQPYSSDPTMNYGGTNLLYSASFSGGNGIPSGTYLGFEDLDPANNPPYFNSDFSYNDAQFVFTTVSAVPLPGAAPLFGAALLGLGVIGFVRSTGRKATAV